MKEREKYDIKQYESGRYRIISQSLLVVFDEVKTVTGTNRFKFMKDGEPVADLKLGNVEKKTIDKLNEIENED